MAFTRENLRAPFNLVLLVLVPAIFVAATASVLAEFAKALGGDLAGKAASTLGAGWSAAFIAGALGFFQAASARDADRRLALAGLGTWRVASARIVSSFFLALVAGAAGFVALILRTGIEHPWHAAAAILGFALIYLAIGVVIGSFVRGALEGSLAVVFVFLLDVFSGPGMAKDPSFFSVSRKAADVLLAAGLGRGSPASDWLKLAAVVVAALAIAFTAFVVSARRRS